METVLNAISAFMIRAAAIANGKGDSVANPMLRISSNELRIAVISVKPLDIVFFQLSTHPNKSPIQRESQSRNRYEY
jgi:hypothetical protein